MGKIAFKIAEKIAPHLSESQWQAVEDYNAKLDAVAIEKYYKKVMRWEKCSHEEAVRHCQDDINYHIGYLMCSPAVMEMLKLPDGSGIERFRKWLTPEEDAVFMSDECPHTPEEFHLIWKKQHKREKKKQAIMGDKYV